MYEILNGRSPLFDLHWRNLLHFQTVCKDIAEANADLNRDAGKENLYNNLLFCLCEQIDLYQKTAGANAETQSYKNSQLFVERDVDTRRPMRGLMQETLKTMHLMNEQFDQNKPFDNVYLLLGDAICSEDPNTIHQRFAELKGIIIGEFKACENAMKYIQQYTDAMETPVKKLTERQKELLDEKNMQEVAFRMARIAKTKVLIDSILKPTLSVKDVPERGPIAIGKQSTREEEKALEELRKAVDKMSKRISDQEKALDYKTDLTPEGYRFKQTYGHKGILDKFTFQSHTLLMDRQFGLKQFECELDCHCKIAQWTNSPGVKCEMTVHVPAPVNGTKVKVNFQDNWETTREALKLYHQAAEKGWEMGKKLGECLFSFDKIADGLAMVKEGFKTMTIGFVKDTTVRFHGKNAFGDIDETLSLVDAIPHMAKKPWMMELQFKKDEFLSEYKVDAPDWIDYKSDAFKKACLGCAKDAVKLGISVSQSDGIGAVKNAVSFYETARDRHEVEMGALTTLSIQSATVMGRYMEDLQKLEIAASREPVYGHHIRDISEAQLYDFDGNLVTHVPDYDTLDAYVARTLAVPEESVSGLLHERDYSEFATEYEGQHQDFAGVHVHISEDGVRQLVEADESELSNEVTLEK